ncbi:hypothetical protein F5J12DRAFT_779752 [Pisolithus orientalis]|uniref:uncharacterized protein n=1 Tax=Pisolithus orientalis TaxID=936130 RepID=UPI0022253AF9|nr:uncharacterized protein F5J12DRAFT_779752 [Pisolithus orientalis]KAI6030654.1 hypothetical protein F5J12DRAFT_779752 [Pisolithus orientalis]
MPHVLKSVDQVMGNSTDLHTQMAPPPEIKKDKPRPWHAVQLPEGWEEHMFGLCDRRRSLTPSVSVSSQNSTALILQEDQVEGTPMDEDAGEAEAGEVEVNVPVDAGEAEAGEVEVNVPADDGSQCPDDGASQLPDNEGFGAPPLLPYDSDEDGSESSLPPSSPPAEDSSSNAGDEFPPCCPGCCVEHKPKSKGKSRAMDVDNSDINMKFKKTGNLSHATLNEVHDFVTEVKAKAEELGCQHSKSPHDILVTAGLSVKPSHMKLNEANLFHSCQPKHGQQYHYGRVQPIMKDIDIPKDDTAARKEKLKAIYEWSESSSAVPANKSVKSIAVRVHNVKTQFSRLAEAWSTLEDIEIAGVVMYVGQDPAGHQTSGIFCGSDIIQKYINEYAIDVWGLMDKYTAIFKCLRDGNGTEAGLLGTIGDPQKIIWQWLLEFVRKNSLIIINWPLGVPPLGPGFEYKKLKADVLCQLVVPYLWRKLGSMYDRQSDDNNDKKNDHLDGVPEVEIKPWNEDVMSIRDAHPLKGEIALVKAPDGMVLCKVSDNPEWQKSHKEEDPGMVAPHAQSGIPFPSCKWACVEVMDNDTVLHEDLHHDAAPSHSHPQDPGPSQQFPPSQHYEVLPPAHCSSGHFPLPCQTYCIPSHPDHHVYHDAPYISDYYPPAQPTAQQWVDRGSAAQVSMSTVSNGQGLCLTDRVFPHGDGGGKVGKQGLKVVLRQGVVIIIRIPQFYVTCKHCRAAEGDF